MISPGVIFVRRAVLVGLFPGLLIFGGGGGGEGLIIGGSFALQKWLGLYLEGILHLKMLRQKECGYKVEEVTFLVT